MKYLYTLFGLLLLGACSSSTGKDPMDPETPDSSKRIARIEIQELFFEDPSYDDRAQTTWDFSYDASGRVSRISMKYVETGEDSSLGSGTGTISFRYGEGTISCEYPIVFAETPRSGSATATLDDEGRIISGVINGYDSKDEVSTVCKYDLYYDPDGYLIRSDVETEYGSESPHQSQYAVTWGNGNPVELQWGGTDLSEKYIDQVRYSTVPNKTNLDLGWLLLQTEGWSGVWGDASIYGGVTNFFALLKYAGPTSGLLPEEVSTGISTWNNRYEYTYQTDSDGYVTAISSKERSKVDNQLYERVKYVITYAE